MTTPYVKWLTDDFLLDTAEAKALYAQYAKPQPIIDYHSHLSPQEIAENKPFANLTRAWLACDHYKWRAMRTVGIPEQRITGDVDDYEIFLAWATTLPQLIRNPLYHWSHLELLQIFGIDTPLTPETAPAIWAEANRQLQAPGMGPRDILIRLGVRLCCTTDDPDDQLLDHQTVNQGNSGLTLLPTWRPGRFIALADTSRPFDEQLAHLISRHDYFHQQGCRLSDYSVESFAEAPLISHDQAKAIYDAKRAGETITSEQAAQIADYMLHFFAQLDAKSNWTRQLHIGALRNPNEAAFNALGPDTGFDAINDFNYAKPLARHLSQLARNNELPRTILYNLNPKDTTMLSVLCGSFQDGTPGGRVNLGPAWWFLDQQNGIEENLNAISQLGCLQQFPGMLTDSRSVMSVPRHDYFRRILCRMLGRDMATGIIPNDLPTIGQIVKKISGETAAQFFTHVL